ncbi:MAG: hypothetical protein ACREA0_20805, partial [bacterium]
MDEAALLLESARLATAAGKVPASVYPLIATFLLTGGRRSEVLGLEVADVSFDHRTVRFRKSRSRGRLKTRTSQRTVPLWPQLEEILQPYVFSPGPAAHPVALPPVHPGRGRDDDRLSEGEQPRYRSR